MTSVTPTLKPLPMADITLEDGVPPPHLREHVKADRLASLDVFRGITIAAMLLVNNPGSWSNIYGPLGHAEWHGWTPTDLIFPFFLFIVGVAIPFSQAKRVSVGNLSRGQLLATIWARAVALVMLGLLLAAVPIWTGDKADALPAGYNVLRALRIASAVFVGLAFLLLLFPWKSRRVAVAVPFIVAALFALLYWSIHFANRQALAAGLPENFRFGSGILTSYTMRFPGVLQRIGVCYGVAATISLFAGRRAVLATAILLMAAYSAVMLAAPYPGHVTGSLTETDNLARHIDVKVFGLHNYGSYPDPEGLVSTLPAIASVLLGVLVGLRLRSDDPKPDKGASVLAWGVIVTIVGVLLSWWLMPINKKIWTPSFTVFTAGMGMLGLGAVFYVADIRGRRAWALPFTIYGVNAIAAFVLAGLAGRLLGLIRFAHPRLENHPETTPVAYAKGELTFGLHQIGGWLGEHVSPALAATVDTPANASLAYAIAFVLAILLVMSVLYVLRVFIKV